jgi:hypothetical protein
MYKYKLTEDDFLQHQLYIASTSEYIIKKRKRAWILLTIAFFVISGFYFASGNITLGGFLALSGLIYLFLYPSIQRRHYIRQYKRHIQNYYQNRVGEEVEVGFSGEHLIANSEASEGKIMISEIIGVSEISNLLFIHIRTGENLIVPKHIDRFNQFKEELQQKTAGQKMSWKDLPNWEFK